MYRRFALLIPLALLLLPVRVDAQISTPAAVIRVVDGDTYHVRTDVGQDAIVRLLLVNTPETRAPRRPVECYGPEASARAHELLDGQRVHLVTDRRGGPHDRYGRTLAYVDREDGTDVGLTLISEGYARVYWRGYPQRDRRAAYRAAEEAAQRESRGLWGAC